MKLKNKFVSRSTVASVDLKHLNNNFIALSKISKHPFLCVMLKANAYGHGDVECAQSLASVGCRVFGVALYEEAIKIANYVKDIDILLFGKFEKSCLESIISNNITPVVFRMKDLRMISENAKNKIKIHLKFNVGMNRLGFQYNELCEIKKILKANDIIDLKGVCSHLPSAENMITKNSSSYSLIREFDKIFYEFKEFKPVGHLFNSAGLLSKNANNYGSRVGIAVYGVDPYFSGSHKTNFLKPVMDLKAEIIDVKKILKGQAVSYSETWVAAAPTRIAILAIGYADGIKISQSNKGYVLISNVKCRIIGRVCMDYTMVDLGEIAEQDEQLIGKQALIFGNCDNQDLHPAYVAKISQTIAYDLFTSTSLRVPRTYSND